jgi:hypothetical protein
MARASGPNRQPLCTLQAPAASQPPHVPPPPPPSPPSPRPPHLAPHLPPIPTCPAAIREILAPLIANALSDPATGRRALSRAVNARDAAGRAPLHVACKHGHAACVAELLASGATSLQAADGAACTWCVFVAFGCVSKGLCAFTSASDSFCLSGLLLSPRMDPHTHTPTRQTPTRPQQPPRRRAAGPRRRRRPPPRRRLSPRRDGARPPRKRPQRVRADCAVLRRVGAQRADGAAAAVVRRRHAPGQRARV